jgi:hypothetical protein
MQGHCVLHAPLLDLTLSRTALHLRTSSCAQTARMCNGLGSATPSSTHSLAVVSSACRASADRASLLNPHSSICSFRRPTASQRDHEFKLYLCLPNVAQQASRTLC